MKHTILSIAAVALSIFSAFAAEPAKDSVISPSGLGLRLEKGKVKMDIPDSLIGRRLLYGAYITESTSPQVPYGTSVSAGETYLLAREDSTILFLEPAGSVFSKDSLIAGALEKSYRPAVLYAFPIKKYNSDSTLYTIEADKLFDMADSKHFSLSGIAVDEMSKISGQTYKSELSCFAGVRSFGSGVALEVEGQWGYTAPNLFGFSLPEAPLAATVEACYCVVDDIRLPDRRRDGRIGTLGTSRTQFEADGPSRNVTSAVRRDFSKPAVYYVDTLMPAYVKEALKSAVGKWNEALAVTGLPEASIILKDFPTAEEDPAFNMFDPLCNVVTSRGNGRNITEQLSTDAYTNRLLAARINIPGDIVYEIRRATVYDITDVDARYSEYFLSEDAMCDYLKSRLLYYVGAGLGLTQNLAGHWAYTPEQLSDADFTLANGISGSAMDSGHLINYFATPGYEGVVMLDRVGPYDRLALKYLYSSLPDDYEAQRSAIDSLLDPCAGKPEYFFAADGLKSIDPRVKGRVCSSDPIASYKAYMPHLMNVVENGYEWVNDDAIPGDYKSLFYEWVYLNAYYHYYPISNLIGGMYVNDTRSGLPRYEAVPKEVQKEAVRTLFEAVREMPEWLDKGKDMLHLGGMMSTTKHFVNNNAFTTMGLANRLGPICTAEELAGSEYTLEEFLDDVTDQIIEISKDSEIDHDGAGNLLQVYVLRLIQESEILTAQYYQSKKTPQNAFDAGFRAVQEGTSVEYYQRIHTACYNELKDIRKRLKHLSSKNEFQKNTYKLCIQMIDGALSGSASGK